jgi:predicted ferric reductase
VVPLVPDKYPGYDHIYAVIALWVLDRAARALRVLYVNFGRTKTITIVEAMPGNACRITMNLARPWRPQPGQHAYLYMPGISLWESHPFTVAWSDSEHDEKSESLDGSRHDIEGPSTHKICFLVRARTGFTNKLFKKVSAAPGGKLQLTAYAEGPYGVKHGLDSYGSVVLFAGGVGITHPVPYIKHLLDGFNNGTVATRNILLVWSVQSPEHLEWIRPWMTEILSMEGRRDALRIMLFVSKPRSSKEIHSPSSTVQMFPGRPNIETLLSMEQQQQTGAMAVTVCGPGSLSDEVRRVVRVRQKWTHVDFIEEAFSW